MKMRLDKMLAHCGYGSRKEVKKYIRCKEVMVNGQMITDDDYKVDMDEDEVMVFNQNITYHELLYIMLNKPKGVVTATFDLKETTILDLVDKYASYKIFPVGRLDKDTTGLLLITNDGQLCHQLLSPKNHVDKKYFVEFEGTFLPEYYEKFEKGIVLEDGYLTLPAAIELSSNNTAMLTIHEGKFHQIKRMFMALGLKVIALKRISFGSLILDRNLKEGEYRLLTEMEIAMLKK